MRMLVIEDEQELSKSIAVYLRKEGYSCDIADGVGDGLQNYDCIVLDISLPNGNGLRILKELEARRRTNSVIVLSDKVSINDRVAVLNLGADDYLTKPFHLSELNARITSIIRRNRFQGNRSIVIHELTIDLIGRNVSVNRRPVALTPKEFDLLLYLVNNKNKVVSRNAIAEKISDRQLSERLDFIYSHMKNLKRKLYRAGCNDYIKSIYGVGYKFTE